MGRPTSKIRGLGQDYRLEVGKDIITTTKSPPQLPTNLEGVYKDVVGDELKGEDIAKL